MVAHDPSFLRDHAPFVHGFFIDGIDTWWTDDASGLMLGSTVSGLTDRTCKPGLKVPDLEEGLDFQTAWLQTTQPTFRLIDFDESLAQLFGKEPDESTIDILAEQILPTTDPLTTIKVQGDASFDPTDKYIGVERIGPSKERRHFPCFNFALPPLYHPVDRDANPVTSRVLVSDAPIVWEGRLVALYRFFLEERNADVTRFGTFANAELVWFGVVRGKARIGPNREWGIPCYGPEGLLKRPLNAFVQTYSKSPDAEGRDEQPWFPMSTRLVLGDDEKSVAVFFSIHRVDRLAHIYYQGSAFHADNDLSDGVPADIARQVGTIVSSVVDGTNTGLTHTTGLNTFDSTTWTDGGRNDATFTREGAGVQIGIEDTLSEQYWAVFHLALHERVWREMGWDPAAQASSVPVRPDEAPFFDMVSGNISFQPWVDNGSGPAVSPRPGYWVAMFWTLPMTSPSPAGYRVDNGGAMRMFRPRYRTGVSSLDLHAPQHVQIQFDRPFWPGELLGFPPAAGVTINGSNLDRTAIFAVRGQFLAEGAEPDEEPEEVVQVCRASWVDDAGHVAGDSDGAGAMYIEQWYDPRTFGINQRWLGERATHWVSPRAGHEIVPMGTIVYNRGFGVETRYEALLRTLVSTGTATWSGNGPTATISAGLHDTGTSGIGGWANDTAAAAMGLGIPTELVADAADIRAAYQEADPSGGWFSPLQQVRLAWIGPVNSEEVIDALTVPAGLGWRLHGGKFGLFSYFDVPSQDDVDLVIGQTDMATTTGPNVGQKLEGQFSTLRLEYRLNPLTRKNAEERTNAALDAAAQFRPGNLERELVDPGAIPASWWRRNEFLPIDRWSSDWPKLWLTKAAQFFGERNFLVTDVAIAREKGIDVRVGTVLRFTNPWPQNPVAGDYGLTDALARVVAVRRTPEAHAICDVLVYASTLNGSLGTYYAPVVRLNGYDSATRTLSYLPNCTETDETIDDTKGLTKPSWASGSGLMHVTLYRWNRREWSTGPTGKVESVDTVNNTITIESPGLTGTYYRDSDYLMIPSDYDNVNQADWVKSIYGVITLADGTFGTGPTQGKRYV